MDKIALVLAVIAGIIFSCTCCHINDNQEKNIIEITSIEPAGNYYGAYLAGRVAHIRHDFNISADYYMKAVEKMPSDTPIINQLYIMLTSQGRIDEAVKYAELAIKNKDKSPFIYTIKSVYEAKHENYQQAIEFADKCDNNFARNLLNPVTKSWFYAGLGQYENAIKALEPLLKDSALHNIYLFNAGAISDYLKKNQEADKYYSMLTNVRGAALSKFPLQVLSNFYLRNSNQEKLNIIKSLAEDQNSYSTQKIIEDINLSSSDISPIITSPLVGLSDSLFGIAAILKNQPDVEEISILFASLAIYANPNYDAPKLLIGNILDSKELYKEANYYYQQIKPEQYNYNIAQFQIAKNLLAMEQFEKAEPILRNLLNYQPGAEVYLSLGEIMRNYKRYKDASIYYQKALDLFPEPINEQRWAILLALGSVYESMGDFDKAEKILRQALSINNNFMVKNYLGYSLLKNRKNIEEAFQLIVDAYTQAPDEGSIIDSLGWALYQIGLYEKAIFYLEKASDASPSEAVIYDHLGDAYWDMGRKYEAVYQWNHAIKLKDSSNELNKETVLQKIKNGKEKHVPIKIDQKKFEKIFSSIKE